jgi:hypothetical protein
MTYLRKLYGSAAVVVGSFFLAEHIWTWEAVDFFDFWGHEWLGFALILLGIGLNINFKRK